MPTGTLKFYSLLTPVFRCNSSATAVECIIGVKASYLASGSTSYEIVYPESSAYPANGTAGMRYIAGQGIGSSGVGEDLWALVGDAAHGVSGNLTVGYAITPDDSSDLPTQPSQGDFVSVATLPLASESLSGEAPTIPQQVYSFSFPMPSRRSTIVFGYKSSGANSSASPITKNIGGGQAVTYAAFSSSSMWVQEVSGHVTTWHVPGVTISASGGASVGRSATINITAPASLRTLTASDFVVTGGTLSNFTRVS